MTFMCYKVGLGVTILVCLITTCFNTLGTYKYLVVLFTHLHMFFMLHVYIKKILKIIF